MHKIIEKTENRWIFIKLPVIEHPNPDTILMRNQIEEDQQHTQWPLGFVCFVAPQAMGAGSDAPQSQNG